MSKHLQTACGYAPGAVALLGNPVGGALTDRIGRRAGFALFCCAMAGAFAVFYLGPCGWAPLVWGVALFAFLASHAVFLALSGEVFPSVSRATLSAVMLAVGALASTAGLWIEAALYVQLGGHPAAIAARRPGFIVAAVVALVALAETSRRALEDG